jgi:hypothetical protein
MVNENYAKPSIGNARELEARQALLQLFKNTPVPDDDILINLGLFTRSVMLAKYLYLNELYQHVLEIPGVIMEFGVWYGANLALLESFRSVYEPYNWSRKVVGFDTFAGYNSISTQDGDSSYVAPGGFSVTEGYEEYLAKVLDSHEQDNVNSQVKKYELIKGDATETIGEYLDERPETIVALAYFDLALYEPTKKCLQAIRPHLVRGSVLAMDELNNRDFPGETIALKEVIGLDRYKMIKSRFLPDRTYIIVD